MRSYQKSLELFERGKKSLAGGVSSQFRAYEQPHPLYYERAEGSRIWDVDGNECLDFTLSQGPAIIGHSHPAVLKAVQEANARGQIFAGQQVTELELAEALQRLIPCAELVRLCVTGSEADHAALRLARAYTGKSKIVKFEGHYHGWLDSVAFSIAPPANPKPSDSPRTPYPWTKGISPGLENNLIILPWNDADLAAKILKEHAHEIAAVITEPVMCNSGCIPPAPGYLEALREACTQHGIVLIFDEIITGFRISLGGAQTHFKVTPDLAIFGKAMGSGFPISALVGLKKIMGLWATGQTIHAGTMNSQNASIAAALATVTELESKAPGNYGQLYRHAEFLKSAIGDAARENGHQFLIQGLGPAFHFGFTSLSKVSNYQDTLSYDGAKYKEFCRAMAERGVRLISRGLWYLSTAHTQSDLELCVKAVRETLAELKSK